MGTPEKSATPTPSSAPFRNFEESPVFKYLSTLSPIEPVKRDRTDSLPSSLALASPSCLFNSPQINFQRDPRFSVRRYQSPDLLKCGPFHVVSEINAGDVSSEDVQVSDQSNEHLKCVTPECLAKEARPQQSPGQLKLVTELQNTLKNACSRSKIQMGFCDELSKDPWSGAAKSDNTLFKHQYDLAETVTDPHERYQAKEINNGSGSDKHALASDGVGLLEFEGQDKMEAETGSSSHMSTVVEFPPVDEISLGNAGSDGFCHFSEQEENEAQYVIPGNSPHKLFISSQTTEVDGTSGRCIQPRYKQQRSIRKRCLVFEGAGANRKKLLYPSTSVESTAKAPCSDKQLGANRTGVANPLSKPRGIGLHLNGLVAASNEGKDLNHHVLTSGMKIITKSLNVSQGSLASCQYHSDDFVTPTSLEKGSVSCKDEVKREPSQPLTAGDEFEHDTPTGKSRNRSELSGETESCKRCNCRRSKCLKLYCDCFAAGLYCIGSCACQDCFNKPLHEDIVMETRRQIEARNPLAFAPKIVQNDEPFSNSGDESNKTPASARHKRGCNCKKSNCLKKYCECFLVGVGCSSNCRCKGCKNTFGKKEEVDGNVQVPEDGERNALELKSQNKVMKTDKESHEDSPSVNLSVNPSEKLAESSSSAAACSPQLQTLPRPRASSLSHCKPKFGSNLKKFSANESSDALDNNQALPEAVGSESFKPPGGSGSRKLVLRSIPQFRPLGPP